MKYIIFGLLFGLGGCAALSSAERDLIGRTKDQVLWQLGDPVVSRVEIPNQIWAYRQDGCSILIYFDETDTVQWVDMKGDCQ